MRLLVPVRPMALGTNGSEAVDAGRASEAFDDTSDFDIGGSPPLFASGQSLTMKALEGPCDMRPSTVGSGPLWELESIPAPNTFGTKSCSPRL